MPPDIKYNVGKFHIALHPARLAYNQPGVFCRISPLSKNFQKFFSYSKVFREPDFYCLAEIPGKLTAE